MKKTTLKDLKDAVQVFVGTIQDVTESNRLSKALRKVLGTKLVCVVSFEFSGFQSHILIRNACKKLGLPCIYEKHAATMGHVVLLSDVNALLNGICKEVKMSCPKMTKVPKIKKAIEKSKLSSSKSDSMGKKGSTKLNDDKKSKSRPISLTKPKRKTSQ